MYPNVLYYRTKLIRAVIYKLRLKNTLKKTLTTL